MSKSESKSESETRDFTGTRTYAGSCHCGAVRFEADLDLGQGTTQCNCRYCTKHGWWGVLTKPAAFRLVAGAEHVEKVHENPVAHRARCKTCGVIPFGAGDVPMLGGAFVSINVRCLEVPSLEGVPVRYLDGRHDTWAQLAVTPWVNPWVGAGAPGLKPAWEG